MPERHLVIGTAGHVDHGKTSLVKALTGVDCDRLPEEKARGLTIELGFARWEVGNGTSASIVDVPGHDRFVGTMVAGAAGIDLVILVVAADDGVMPQTREHLAICSLLGIRTGVVALTKADLADPELLALVREDVQQTLAETSLGDAEIVTCSARDGRGLAELAAAVQRAATRCPPTRHDDERAYLCIDRAFTLLGRGTVVTGTLARGTIRVSDDLDAFVPSRTGAARVKVRELQVHGGTVEVARAATRLALNLRSATGDAVERGGVLASPGWLTSSNAVCAEIELAVGAEPLPKRCRLVAHVGTHHHVADVVALEANGLSAGTRCVVRLSSATPFVSFCGQRIVLRRPDLETHRTVAGGRITDPCPILRRTSPRKLPAFPLQVLSATDACERVRLLVDDSQRAGISLADVIRRMPPDDCPERALQTLSDAGAVIAIETNGERRYWMRTHVDEAASAILPLLRDFHRERPVLSGVSPAEIESKLLRYVPAVLREALSELRAREKIFWDKGLVGLAGRRQANEGGQDVRRRVAQRYTDAHLAPPSDTELARELELDARIFRDAVAELTREGKVRLLTEGMHFDVAALDELKRSMGSYFRTHARLTPPDFKEFCGGITRKHAMPLLEWLDTQRVTRREGDARVAGPAALESSA